jgi:hypothetical protein
MTEGIVVHDGPLTSKGRPRKAVERSYDEQAIERGLTELALCAGNAGNAHKRLKAQGYDIPKATLQSWRTGRHAGRYERIHHERMADIDSAMVSQYRDLVGKAVQTAANALDVEQARLAAGDVKDASASARNAGVVAGIGETKLGDITGRPSVVVHEHDASGLVDKLERFGVLQVVEGTAEEVPVLQLPTPTEATNAPASD